MRPCKFLSDAISLEFLPMFPTREQMTVSEAVSELLSLITSGSKLFTTPSLNQTKLMTIGYSKSLRATVHS